MIAALLFDFIETLGSAADGFRAAEKAVQRKIFEHLQVPHLGPVEWPGFQEIYRRERKSFHERGCFSRRLLWERVYAGLGRTREEDLLDRWEDEYWTTVEASMRLFPEAPAVLSGLASRFRLGLVTNQQRQGGTRGLSFPAFSEVAPYFPVLVVGGEEGVPPKPAPAAFQEGLRRLGVRAEEAVFVGDDWKVDICGAREVGIRPVWLQHHSVQRNWPPGDAQVTVISSLWPLLQLESLLAGGS